MPEYEFVPNTQPGSPDFLDLPWGQPFHEWENLCSQVEEVQHGISRHPVVFVNYAGILYAIKELPENVAQKEYELLLQMDDARLPCVKPIGYANLNKDLSKYSVLFTRFLESSIPYRSLFISSAMDRYRTHLLDAVSGLLVQLHSAGFYWGDCSLSNVLFRRDAGALQAYLVDAETAEYHLPRLSPMLRYHDLEIMQENINSDLADLEENGHISFSYPVYETGTYIQQRYRSLWEEITREEVFSQNEHFRIQERIRAINSLGFSVRDVEIKSVDQGDKLKLRIFVSDRNYHRDQLMEITGLDGEEMQARKIMNEIYELKAYLSQTSNPNITLEAVAYHWLENLYKPAIEHLTPLISKATLSGTTTDPIELYCQILEHKWFLSERARHDVGHQMAVEDYLKQFG
jgi:tRNA A-37 threonylcarbamoyl transferase component Bud32